ncbi:MAG TPA: plastocyanin/azurin family copper-binding protein [Nitrososphaeraceae archaeon]|nr:plastocyanin/azurin family copper-binding protein [Nitrososphaeraceae archaeon]
MNNHAAGISIIAFIVTVMVSMSYYQFVYTKEANAKPQLPEEVLNPPQPSKVSILEGSAQPSQQRNFDPKEIRGTLGISNKVIWTNVDTTAHTVTTDAQYNDQISGPFNSVESTGLILPQNTFEFTFTKDGEYPYHCEPHPWMTGKVIIVKSFV